MPAASYQLLALPPGAYDVKVELSGFRTAVRQQVTLAVDSSSKLDMTLQIGSLSETVNVTTEVSPLNTTDASLGNVITGQQVRTLPLEANNVVGLLSLQPGAVYIPNSATTDARTGAVQNIDPRSGAVSGSRADQSNVTLDGIDVNDPQFGTAYSSAVRVTLDSLQEFRVSTSNYGADSGRSSGAQVSLVTKSGTNDYHGAANWVQRNTRFSSNDYFLKLSQLQSGEPSVPPKLDKKIFGGALGGPVKKDRLFFFGNYERLTEDSESPVLRNIPSMSMRDGVLIYQCADPAACPATSVQGFSASHDVPAGHHGMTPAELATVDPLGIGPSKSVSDYFSQFPTPNDPGIDGLNLVGYRFAAPLNNAFNTYIGRADFRASPSQTLFGRANFQDDTIVSVPQYPGEAANTTRTVTSRGFAFGWDSVLSSSMVNTFRYGLTQINEKIGGLANRRAGGLPQHRRDRGADGHQLTRHPDQRHRRRHVVDQGIAHLQVRRHRALHARRQLEQLELVPHPAGQRIMGGTASARPTCPARHARSRRVRRATRCRRLPNRAPRPTATR